MPHRVDGYAMSSSYVPFYSQDHQHQQSQYSHHHHHPHSVHHHQQQRRPSPPPIATLTHSPSPSLASLDRSSASTPTNRRNSPPPPPSSQGQGPPPPSLYSSPYSQPPRTSYMYSSHPFEQPRSPYHPSSAVPHLTVPSMQSAPPPPPPANQGRDSYHHSYPIPGQATQHTILTDDAATKLSDRVRRRCFNCCTTDTSTWRRSNLSPGKVLCNKCGLFERTHSRPRPEQFPHKRGPLAASTLRSRSPPVNQLPPISANPPPHPSQHQQHQQHQQPSHHNPTPPPPHHYTHPSIAPLHSNVQDTRRDYHNGSGTTTPTPTSAAANSLSAGMTGPGGPSPIQSELSQHHHQQHHQQQQHNSSGSTTLPSLEAWHDLPRRTSNNLDSSSTPTNNGGAGTRSRPISPPILHTSLSQQPQQSGSSKTSSPALHHTLPPPQSSSQHGSPALGSALPPPSSQVQASPRASPRDANGSS
ncbi:hypothetical protein BDN72DRAFT_133754 [Pluteus cervinus]|uniref:Uncharacterized protein n=1 Tax=Pluteus cervinus TaxID=181527 RepID=A0ACD3ALU3_9AGAR|nr:hypothetical protein BDN72DRAFT_133754 [Pluteus cervinus]